MKVAIIYNLVCTADGSKLNIGGVQTYLLRLASVVNRLGWEARIFQLSNVNFLKYINNVSIIGIPGIPVKDRPTKIGRFLSNHAEDWIGQDAGLIIFGTDSLFVPTKRNSLAIQHGVSWDLPPSDLVTNEKFGCLSNCIIKLKINRLQSVINGLRNSKLNKIRRVLIDVLDSEKKYALINKNLVCVDYNYYNVRKSTLSWGNINTWIIPNHSPTLPHELISNRIKNPKIIKIIFARRFVAYRGTRFVSLVFERLLQKYIDLEITFAGEGEDESWLRDYFSFTKKVKFMRYLPERSAEVFLSQDIAVIPSLGSEGTSLAALEAMAAKCVVVATCVGGLTNIIIDGYNGRLVIPEEEPFFLALDELCSNSMVRERLAEKGYETLISSFSLERWQERWEYVLQTFALERG